MISPLRCASFPALFSCIIMRSMWYRYSSKSSMKSILPLVFISEGVAARA